jgi:uncharacterized protein YhjY with autotransporter beta-barrel domain
MKSRRCSFIPKRALIGALPTLVLASLAHAQTTPPPPFGTIGRDVSRAYAGEALTTFSLLSLRNINPVVRNRMEQARLKKSLRELSFAQWDDPDAPPVLLAQAGGGVVVPTAQDTQATSPWGTFATLAHDTGSLETQFSKAAPTQISNLGFDGRYSTLSMGGDYRLGNDWLFGGAASFGRATADLANITNTIITGSAGRINGNVGEVSGYMTWTRNSFYVDTYLTFSTLNLKVNRNVLVGNEVRVASGSPRGTQLSAGLSAGYDWKLKAHTISPYARVEGLKLRINGYSESGSNGFDAQLSRQTRDSLQGVLGLRYNHALSLDFGVLVPQVSFEFVRELRDRPSTLIATPLSSTVSSLPSTTPASLDKSYGTITLGATGQFSNNWSGFAQVEHYVGFTGVKKTIAKLGVQKEI